MQDKLCILLIYGLFGLLIALCPALVRERLVLASRAQPCGLSSLRGERFWKSMALAISALGIILIAGESRSIMLVLEFGLLAVVSSYAAGKFDITVMLSGFLSLCVSATILWWRRQDGVLEFNGFELLTFGLVTFVFTCVFTNKEQLSERGFSFKWLLPYVFLAAVLSFSTGILNDNNQFLTLWHHWGAYIGPAELLLTGAAVFHDFPMQYGLGPTALIASSCSSDCWQGMYFITGFTTLTFSVLIAVLALALTNKRWPERCAVLVLCLITCFFWAAYPPDAGSPIITPSVSGLRFLPVVLMVTYLFFIKNIEHSTFRMFIAHGLWMLGILWSPESAFYLTCVWWPYYIFVRRGQGDMGSRFKAIFNSVIRLCLIAAGFGVVFKIVYQVIYHKVPTIYGILAYAINPPGSMPIDSHGGIWYFLLAMIIGVVSLFRTWRKSGDTLLFRYGFLVILLSYSAFSYFLGRSHDNNLLNIMPFVLLVLLYAIAAAGGAALTRGSVILVAALIGWLPVFGWKSWHDNLNFGTVLSFQPESFREAISYSNPATQSKLLERSGLGVSAPADAGRAIDFIHQRYGEPVTVLDYFNLQIGAAAPDVWSAIHAPVNFFYIPSVRRREFLSATAATLNRPGWLIIDQRLPADEWLADFDSVYDRTGRLEFGTYYAIRFSPKTIG